MLPGFRVAMLHAVASALVPLGCSVWSALLRCLAAAVTVIVVAVAVAVTVAGCCLHNVNDAARLCRGSFHAVCKKQMSNSNSGQKRSCLTTRSATWGDGMTPGVQWTHCIPCLIVLPCRLPFLLLLLLLPFMFICILFQFGGIIKCFRCGRWRSCCVHA